MDDVNGTFISSTKYFAFKRGMFLSLSKFLPDAEIKMSQSILTISLIGSIVTGLYFFKEVFSDNALNILKRSLC